MINDTSIKTAPKGKGAHDAYHEIGQYIYDNLDTIKPRDILKHIAQRLDEIELVDIANNSSSSHSPVAVLRRIPLWLKECHRGKFNNG